MGGVTMSPMVPEITTPRLRLRAHQPQDLDPAARLWAMPAIYRYTIGEASDRSRTWGRLMIYRGMWEMLGYGYWAIEHDGAYIGEAGIADFGRNGVPPRLDGLPEAGWVMDPAFHGQGLAQEALRAIMDWALLRHPHVFCMIDPENQPSLTLAKRIGFTQTDLITMDGEPNCIFECRRAGGA